LLETSTYRCIVVIRDGGEDQTLT